MNDPFFIGLDSENPAKVVLGRTFQSHIMQLHDASMHYVSGGSGPAILFLHGFSQDWYEFSQVMCLLFTLCCMLPLPPPKVNGTSYPQEIH